jgi:glucose/mannose-6-phosphate isomerase
VVPVHAATLPAFAARGTLVFACSYSGSTEETLETFEAARQRGASVVAVTSGGVLAERARAHDCPVLALPPGQPPRSALPYQLTAMLRVMAALGLTRIGDAEVTEAVRLAERLAAAWGPAVPSADNLAKQLARRLHRSLPVIYAASADLAPVAYRWKTQINEHAKTFAVANAFPEVSHNETVGWGRVAELGIGPAVVILRDRDDGSRASREVEAARILAFGAARSIDEVWSQGEGPLARLVSLVVLGDFASVYLAALGGVDPTPIDVIAAIKRRLQEAPGARGT